MGRPVDGVLMMGWEAVAGESAVLTPPASLPHCTTKSLKSEIDVTFVYRAVARAMTAMHTGRGTAWGVLWVVFVIGWEAVAGESVVCLAASLLAHRTPNL